MATIERDVVLQSMTSDRIPTIDLPVTRLGNIEHTSGDKTTMADEDLIPLFDSTDGKEAKKITFANLIAATKGKLGSVYAAKSHTHKVADVTGAATTQDILALQAVDTGHAARIARLEDAMFSNITGNPWTVTFDALSGLKLAKGNWNEALQRLEC